MQVLRRDPGRQEDRAPTAKLTTTLGHRPRALAGPTILVVATVCAVIVSWTLYGRADMSLDEGYTVAEAHLPLTDLLTVIWHREMNGSLHTLISWVLVNALNLSSVTGIRIVSTVFTIITVLVTARIIAELYGPRYTPWAALLLASPLVLQQMVDARTYALTLMLTAISLRMLLAAQATESLARVSAWAVLNGFLIYAHFFGLAVIAGECAWLVAQRVRHRARWIAGLGMTALLALPLVVFLIFPGAQQHQLLPHPRLKVRDYVAQSLALILGDQSKGQRVLQFVAALFLVIVLVVIIRNSVNRRSTYLAAPLVVAPPLLGFAMSLSVPASFASRYLIPSLLGIALLTVGALSGIRSSTGRLLMRTAIVLAFGIPIAYTIVARPSVSEMTYRSDAMNLIKQKASADAIVTSAVPYEGAVDHYYATASGLTFLPYPTTSSAFLAGSVYTNRAACDGLPEMSLPSQLWLVSEMSPDFDAAIGGVARCTNLRVRWMGARGPVRIVEFSRG